MTHFFVVLRNLVQLAALGLFVGIACWPFNVLDRWQDQLLTCFPAFSQSGWSLPAVLLATTPTLLVPLLLLLQRGALARGSGSGIPQVLFSLERPSDAQYWLGPSSTLQRFLLWTLATIGLLPLGREGPLVQAGAAVAHALRRRFPSVLPDLAPHHVLTIAAGAGLAGGFDTPLLGVIFIAEELTQCFQPVFLWPALVVCAVAASFSNLTGQPEFLFGLLTAEPAQLAQVLWALPIGVTGGLFGGLFAAMLLSLTQRIQASCRRWPLRLGALIGITLTLGLWISGGASGGDGETLLARMLSDEPSLGVLPPGPLHHLLLVLLRFIPPLLPLAAGIPGGLIDPALTFGALLGQALSDPFGAGVLGTALGMSAGLAGATQLPIVSILLSLRLAGDQQLLPGMVVSTVLAAMVSRLLQPQPIYHALTEALRTTQGSTTLRGYSA